MAAAKVARAKKRLSASISELLGANRKSQLNAHDTDGLTIVHRASLMGNVEILRTFIQTGTDINIQDNKGMTPLHYAAWQSTPEVASLLLRNGAKPDVRNNDGFTPLHVACQYGQNDLVNLLIYYHADPYVRSTKNGLRPFDLACEYGRAKVVELLLDFTQQNNTIDDQSLNGILLLPLNEQLSFANCHSTNSLGRKKQRQRASSPLNLAAKNGHVDVLSMLLDKAALDINRADPVNQGNTALHDAAVHLRAETVLFLLLYGADCTLVNDADKTALDLLKKNSLKSDPTAQKIKRLLKEAAVAVYGKALRDYRSKDEQGINFQFADIIWILDRTDERRWKGAVFGAKSTTKIGYFPADTVQLIDKKIGMQRSASQRHVKKVNVPSVPDIPGMAQSGTVLTCTSQVTQPSSLMNDHHASTIHQSTCTFHSNTSTNAATLTRNSSTHSNYGSVASTRPIMADQSDRQSGMRVQDPSTNGHSQQLHHPHQTTLMSTPSAINANGILQTIVSPARHRNSTGSNSSQASSGFESMKSGTGQAYVNVTVHQLRGDSPPSRNSVHSSGSSSLGSLERLDESGYGSASHINVAEMVFNGVPDQEVLRAWLHDLRYEEYLPLFINAGYDLPTVSRMTPEDLTAIGITKPGHRKRLTTEIHKLNLDFQWPERKPETLRTWLCLLKLSEYVPLFESQGITNVDQLSQLTWEDYEDFGVKKLGHLKKLVLASKKIKDYRQQMNRTGPLDSSYDSGLASTEMLLINVPTPSVCSNTACGRTTAEVRPYSHVPPEMMSTFHQPQQNSPRQMCNDSILYRPDLISIASSNVSSSPSHRLYTQQNVSTIDQQHYFQNHQHQQNHFVTTEAVVHDRPKVTVKPLLSSTLVSRRDSKEGLEMLDDCKINNSPLMQSPRHRQLHQQSTFLGTNNCYVNVPVGGSTGDVSNDYRFVANRPVSATMLPSDIMCRSAPPPLDSSQQPPQKPPIGPLARPGAVFQLSANPLQKLTQTMDENTSFDELSPAPSMDEFPPPPSPILCVESIKNLRNVREHNPHSATIAMTSEDNETDFDLIKSDSSNGTLVRKRLPPYSTTNGSHEQSSRQTTSTTSIESTSSTETLPFANENVGTIRQKNNQSGGTADSSTPTKKPHVNELFLQQQQKDGSRSTLNANENKSTCVLNDINSMLQDLTDELDALLKEPNQQQNSSTISS